MGRGGAAVMTRYTGCQGGSSDCLYVDRGGGRPGVQEAAQPLQPIGGPGGGGRPDGRDLVHGPVPGHQVWREVRLAEIPNACCVPQDCNHACTRSVKCVGPENHAGMQGKEASAMVRGAETCCMWARSVAGDGCKCPGGWGQQESKGLWGGSRAGGCIADGRAPRHTSWMLTYSREIPYLIRTVRRLCG